MEFFPVQTLFECRIQKIHQNQLPLFTQNQQTCNKNIFRYFHFPLSLWNPWNRGISFQLFTPNKFIEAVEHGSDILLFLQTFSECTFALLAFSHMRYISWGTNFCGFRRAACPQI